MSSILIKGARVIAPAEGIDRVSDVYVQDGIIAELDSTRTTADTVLEAPGADPLSGFRGHACPPAGPGLYL